MSDWIILAAPLLIAGLALAAAFAGCSFQPGVAAQPEYSANVKGEASLVSYWRLGEAPGATVAADSKDGNNGQYNGGVTLGVPGLINSSANTTNDTAAQFDGASGYVSVPLVAALNPPQFTVEVLVQIDGGTGTRAIVSSAHVDSATGNVFGYGVRLNAQDQWVGFAGDGATPGAKVATVGQAGAASVSGSPYYVALTYDGTTLTLYVNPVDPAPPTSPDQVATLTIAIAPNAVTELRIGAANNDGPAKAFFNGVLDEVAIYNDALDYDTLRTHYFVMAMGQVPS